MQKIYAYLDLDFSKRDMKSLPIIQGDNSGRVIVITLYNGNNMMTVDPETDTVTLAAFVGTKRAAKSVSVPVQIVEGSGMRIALPITQKISRYAGEEKCILKISNAAGTAQAAFVLNVLKNAAHLSTKQEINLLYPEGEWEKIEYHTPEIEDPEGGDVYVWINDEAVPDDDFDINDDDVVLNDDEVDYDPDRDDIDVIVYKKKKPKKKKLKDLGIEFNTQEILKDIYLYGGGGAASIGHWNSAHTKFDWKSNGEYLECGLDLLTAFGNSNAVHVYEGGAMPPAIYVSGKAKILQNGVTISAGLFLVINDTQLLKVNAAQLVGYGKIHYDPTEQEAEEKGWVSDDMFHWLKSSWSSATSEDEPGHRIVGRYCYAIANVASGSGHSGSDFTIYENGIEKTCTEVFGTGEAMYNAVSAASGIIIDFDEGE